MSMVPVPFKGQRADGAETRSALPVAAIYGANASGKTNVLRALEFTRDAVVESHSSWKPDGGVPRQAFAGSDDGLPSRFVVDFELNGRRHQYGFAVTSAAVEDEWLHVFPKGKRQVWYSRQHWNKFAFGAKLKGENETIRALTRRNSLFLSAAAQNNHEQLLPVYRWFSDYVSAVTGSTVVRSHSAPFLWEPPSLDRLSKYLNKADLGIVGAKFDFLQLKLLHQVGSATVPFESDQESAGTLVYLNLLGPILQTLAVGGLLCIDELDASLHPLLVAEILKLFREPTHSSKPAQLIFTAHNTNPMTALGRDQIWFTEKDNAGASQLYPLSDFKPRRQENLELGYVQGRYGGIPLLGNSEPLAGADGADGTP